MLCNILILKVRNQIGMNVFVFFLVDLPPAYFYFILLFFNLCDFFFMFDQAVQPTVKQGSVTIMVNQSTILDNMIVLKSENIFMFSEEVRMIH